MCGLVGMAGTMSPKLRDVMKDLLYFDTLRGRDSTGLGAVRRNRTVMLKKITVPGYDFIEHPNINDWLLTNDQLWMGHNRFKTIGDASRANAHPFFVLDEDDNIGLMGAHNGTLRNKYEIEKELTGDDRYGTDSEALMNLIAEKDTFKEAMALVEGAWSLTVWDPVDNTINFLRNKERPMIYAFTKDNKTLIWASETWMILSACRRHGVDLAETEGSPGMYCYQTTEDTLYTLTIPQGFNEELGGFTKVGGVQGKPERKFPHQGYASGRQFWESMYDDDDLNVDRLGQSITKTTPETSEEKPQSTKTQLPVVHLGPPPLVGFNGKPITQAILQTKRKRGCVWCEEEVTDSRPAHFDEVHLLCSPCLHGSTDRRAYALRREEVIREKNKNNVIDIKAKQVNQIQEIVEQSKRGSKR